MYLRAKLTITKVQILLKELKEIINIEWTNFYISR